MGLNARNPSPFWILKGARTGPIDKVRTVLRGLLQRFGTVNFKRQLWNQEYGRGSWNCLDTMTGDCVYPYAERYVKNGCILDLGCGPGAVGNELNASAYDSYIGVDISDVAIEKARRRTTENHRTGKNHYFQGDILSYVPKGQYDVILFGDSIYYFRPQRTAEMLTRYSKYLKPDGALIVRSWVTHHRSRAIIRNIERDFDVVEKHLYHESQIVVIVFQPPASRRAALRLAAGA